MVEPLLGTAIGLLVKSAPGWFHTLESILWDKGKDFAGEQVKQRISGFIDEKKHQRNMELALQNAAERGLRKFQTLVERDHYRSVLEILAGIDSSTLRQEGMRLLTLSDNPDFTVLTEKYNLRQRISAIAQDRIYEKPQTDANMQDSWSIKGMAEGKAHEEVDTAPYLSSFFEALLAELYNDPLFRGQMSDVIQVRAALAGQRTLEDMRTILSQIYSKLADDYAEEQFQREIGTYLEYVEMKFRRHNFTGIVFKGDEDKAPDVENIFVPLRIVTQQARIFQDRAQDDLRGLFEQSPYQILLGKPGAGKSTLTRYMAWSSAKANLMSSTISSTKNPVLLPSHPVPLRIELRLLSEARKRQNCGFLSYATEVMLREEDIAIHTQMFIELLERKVVLILFDGLDEVPTLSERRQLVEQIENFAERYPGNAIMVTSRPVGYELARFANSWFTHGDIQDFNDEQISAFLEGWYRHVLKFPSLTGEVRHELDAFYTTLQNNLRLHNLATNPLLLTVMASLYHYKRLPDKRVDLYKECADLLLDTWAKLKYKEPRFKDMKMGQSTQRDCLAHVGLFLHTRSQEEQENEADTRQKSNQSGEDTATDVPAEEMQREIERFLKSENLLSGAEISAEAERFLDLVKTEAGLIVERGTDERGPLYGFVHRTFQEYFSAVAIVEQSKDDPTILSDFLEEHLHDPHWNEVILLLLGQLRHKQLTTLFRHLLRSEFKSRRSKYTDILQQDLFFICTCLIEEIIIEQDFAEDVVSYLSELVKHSPFTSQREQALEMFGMLMQTRQYSDIGLKTLKILVTQNIIPDIVTRIRAVQTLYEYGTSSPDEQQAIQILLSLVQHPDLSFAQVLKVTEAFYEWNIDIIMKNEQNTSNKSKKEQQAVEMLLSLLQRSNISFEEILLVAETLYKWSSNSSEDQYKASQILLELAKLPDISIKQLIRIAKTIPSKLEERQQIVLKILAEAQNPDLSFESATQIIETCFQNHLLNFDKQRVAVQILLDLVEQPSTSFEQSIKTARLLYTNIRRSRVVPTEDHNWAEDHNWDFFDYYVEFEDNEDNEIEDSYLEQWATSFSIEEAIQIARILYKYVSSESQERYLLDKILFDLAERPDTSFEQAVQIMQILNEYSSFTESDKQRLIVQMLLELAQRPYISVIMIAQTSLTPHWADFTNSKERKQAIQILLKLAQQSDLPSEGRTEVTQILQRIRLTNLEEQELATQILSKSIQQSTSFSENTIKVAQTTHWHKLFWLEQEQKAIEILSNLEHPLDLFFKDAIWIVHKLYRSSSDGSYEQKQNAQILLNHARRATLPFEQAMQIALTLYEYSPTKSEERAQAAKVLLNLAQRPALSFEQAMQVALTLYEYSPTKSQEKHLAAQLLLNLVQQPYVSFEDAMQAAQALYQLSPTHSEEQRQAIKILLYLAQRSDVSIERRVLLTQTLYPISCLYKYEEEESLTVQVLIDLILQPTISTEQAIWIARTLSKMDSFLLKTYNLTQILLVLVLRADLSFEQLLWITETLYNDDCQDQKEQKQITKVFQHILENQNLSLEQHLQIVTIPLRVMRVNYLDRAQAVRIVLSLLNGNDAMQYLEKHWVSANNLEAKLPDTPYIAELVKHEVLPVKARDEMYQILNQMVPQFEKIDAPNE